jgi:hypothetical protein
VLAPPGNHPGFGDSKGLGLNSSNCHRPFPGGAPSLRRQGDASIQLAISPPSPLIRPDRDLVPAQVRLEQHFFRAQISGLKELSGQHIIQDTF